MNRFAATVLMMTLCAGASAQSAPTKTKQVRTPRAEVQACKDRLKELADLNDHMDVLTPEKLVSVQKEVNDCVFAESAGLSKDDIIAAYKLRDSTGREVIKRIREAAEKTVADDNSVRAEDKEIRESARKIAQGFLEEDKGYKDLVQRYNALVENYNSTVQDYRATVDQNGRFLQSMQQAIQAENYNCQVNALQSLLNSAARTRPQVVYRAPTQLHCSTQNMPAPVAGLPSWTYTSCY